MLFPAHIRQQSHDLHLGDSATKTRQKALTKTTADN